MKRFLTIIAATAVAAAVTIPALADDGSPSPDGSAAFETCLRARTAIVRAEAPLAVLIGLPALLDVMTRGNAVATIRLLRYAPLPMHIDPASA